MNQTNENEINGEVLIVSIFIVIAFIYFTKSFYNDQSYANIILAILLFYNFLFVWGTLEKHEFKVRNLMLIIINTIVTIFIVYLYIAISSDFFKWVLTILSIIPIYNIIFKFYKMYIQLRNINNNIYKNIAIIVVQLTTFILAVLQLLQIFKLID